MYVFIICKHLHTFNQILKLILANFAKRKYSRTRQMHVRISNSRFMHHCICEIEFQGMF